MMFAGTHAYFTMEEPRTCSVNYFCFGALLIFIGSILLCSLGFTIVLPFHRTQSWAEVDCRVVRAEVNQSLCACEGLAYPGCSKFSPCLQVIIAYNATFITQDYEVQTTTHSNQLFTNSLMNELEYGSRKNSIKIGRQDLPRNLGDNRRWEHGISLRTNLSGGIERTHVVHRASASHLQKHNDQNVYWLTTGSGRSDHRDDYVDNSRVAMLYRSWSDVFYTYCSLHECGDESWNDKETWRFKAKWGALGKTFPCFVDPLRPDIVILTRTSFWAMLHAVLWPTICLFVGVTLWLGLCCGCWSLESDNSTSAYYGVL